MIGCTLATIAALDIRAHCTHLFELAILCAAHASDSDSTTFDLWMADRQGTQSRAIILHNGQRVLCCQLNGTLIVSPQEWAGRDLRRLSAWKGELSPADAELAWLLRRTVFLSGGRSLAHRPTRASDWGPERMGVCFTYQMPRATLATTSPDWRHDFSNGTPPLQDFDPDWR
jgi:hypothetical protein